MFYRIAKRRSLTFFGLKHMAGALLNRQRAAVAGWYRHASEFTRSQYDVLRPHPTQVNVKYLSYGNALQGLGLGLGLRIKGASIVSFSS